MIKFAKTADATARTKKLCRDQGLPVEAVYSRYIDCGMRFRTRISLGRNASEEDRERAVAMLEAAGYEGVVIDTDPLNTINAYSALTGGESSDPVAELARRALVEQAPESFSADEVSAMDDNEAIATAVGAGVLGG